MNKPIQIAILLLVCVFAAAFTACSASITTKPNNVLKVGVPAGPQAEIMKVVKTVAEKDGLTVVIVEMNDYAQLNVALSQGDIDLNSFQNQPYLDTIVKDRKYEIIPIAKTVISPLGIYSQKIKNLSAIAPGSTIVIPNDPTNVSRALLLLEKAGLLVLDPRSGSNAAITNIIQNPNELMIIEMDIAQIPRSLTDGRLAVMNAHYASTVGLSPAKDALLSEGVDSPYVNVIAARKKDVENPAIQKFLNAYHSQEVKQFIQNHFKGLMLTAW